MIVEKFAEDLWIAEGEIVNFYGFAYPTRCVIVRLADGSLWVWSPIRLSLELKGEVATLGSVAHLVSPNKIHHLYLKEWHEVFPEAKLWGPNQPSRSVPICPSKRRLRTSHWRYGSARWTTCGSIDRRSWMRLFFFTQLRRPRSLRIFRRISASGSSMKTGNRGRDGLLGAGALSRVPDMRLSNGDCRSLTAK